jgi:hypothetical protein
LSRSISFAFLQRSKLSLTVEALKPNDSANPWHERVFPADVIFLIIQEYLVVSFVCILNT